MFRCYNIKEGKWANNILLSTNNDLTEVKEKKFGYSKLNLVPDSEYVFHRDIGLYDRDGWLIFEGDMLQTPNGLVGIVAYSEENASFVFLEYENKMYYPLFKKVCNDSLRIVGNVFDTPELVPGYECNHEIEREIKIARQKKNEEKRGLKNGEEGNQKK